MDDPSDRLLPTFLAEYARIDPFILFGLEVGFSNLKAIFRLAIQGSGESETAMLALLENVGSGAVTAARTAAARDFITIAQEHQSVRER